MKTGIKFTISAIQAGQKSATLNATPQLIAKSTLGQFVITAPVSKALGIAPGENVQFLNNISGIEQAIQSGNKDIAAYAEEKGYDLTTREGQESVIEDLAQWYIAKGTYLFTKTGEPVKGTVRVSAAEKQAYIDKNGVAMIEALSDEEKAAFAEANEVDVNDMDAMVAALTPDNVPSPTFHQATGSRTASTSNSNAVGVQLNFTDTAIWNNLKSDVEDKGSVNRVFDVDLENAETVEVFNGLEKVQVLAYPIEFSEDAEPIRRNGADED